MPNLTREELWRQLKQGIIAPVYVLFGSEPFLRDRASAEIINHAFSDGDLRDFNLDEFTLNNRDAVEAAIAAAQQLPMMSERRVVKVTDVRVTATSTRDTLKEESEELLGRYLADPSPSTVMIFIADELNGNRKITKLLTKHAVSVKFEKLGSDDLNTWIARQFDEQGFRIDNLALRRLGDLIGADLRRLTNEVAKLCAASLPSKIATVELVEALVPNTNEIENFALTDAIVSGRGRHALDVLKKILDDGAEPVQLLGLLLYNFRRLLLAKEMMSSGRDRREVAVILRMRYNDQEDFLAAARRADRQQLLKTFDRLAETDLAMKTSLGGGGDQGTRMQIEVLVCEIAAAMGR
jgi:DNA polymerase III, delta subunit